MKYYCSLSDSKYTLQAIALFKSLKEHSSENFTFFYLCLDDEILQKLTSNFKEIKCITLLEIENYYPFLKSYKSKVSYNQYCWVLASIFCRFLLENEIVPEVLYIDSDIYFYKNPNIIFDEQGEKSIGIIRHRHNTKLSPDGEYNVGIIYFRNDKDGRSCVKWWSDSMIQGLHPELATCGDQKYLENFEKLYPNSIKILDETFAHGAPWNFRLYVYDTYFIDGSIIWGNKKQPLLFNHFSKFKFNKNEINPTAGHYLDHTLNMQIFNIPAIKFMYIDYHHKLIEISKI